MERYGYLFTAEVENDTSGLFPKPTSVIRVQQSFFKNIDDCIRHAISCNPGKEKEKRCYLKILKNSDVVRHMHDTTKERTYGYLYLYCKNDVEQISLFSSCITLFDNMLDCVSAEKHYSKYAREDNANCSIKIAYFMLLKDDDILRELHRPTCI